jgi:hypothetical protein
MAVQALAFCLKAKVRQPAKSGGAWIDDSEMVRTPRPDPLVDSPGSRSDCTVCGAAGQVSAGRNMTADM